MWKPEQERIKAPQSNEMKQLFLALVIIFIANPGFSITQAHHSKRRAVVVFAGEKSDYSTTYLGKLKRGDLNSLRDYLKQLEKNGQSSSGSQQQTNSSLDNYVKLITKNKRSSKRKNNYLSDDYDIKEGKLKKGNHKYYRKYLKEKEKAASEKEKVEKKKPAPDKTIDYREFTERNSDRKGGYLSRYYKIKGKKLRKGKKLKFREGNISLIIKYEIRTGRSIKSYVNVVDGYVKAGSKYDLKYYGTGAKRKYFLELAPLKHKN